MQMNVRRVGRKDCGGGRNDGEGGKSGEDDEEHVVVAVVDDADAKRGLDSLPTGLGADTNGASAKQVPECRDEARAAPSTIFVPCAGHS